jgi:hypothetical protein
MEFVCQLISIRRPLGNALEVCLSLYTRSVGSPRESEKAKRHHATSLHSRGSNTVPWIVGEWRIAKYRKQLVGPRIWVHLFRSPSLFSGRILGSGYSAMEGELGNTLNLTHTNLCRSRVQTFPILRWLSVSGWYRMIRKLWSGMESQGRWVWHLNMSAGPINFQGYIWRENYRNAQQFIGLK